MKALVSTTPAHCPARAVQGRAALPCTGRSLRPQLLLDCLLYKMSSAVRACEFPRQWVSATRASQLAHRVHRIINIADAVSLSSCLHQGKGVQAPLCISSNEKGVLGAVMDKYVCAIGQVRRSTLQQTRVTCLKGNETRVNGVPCAACHAQARRPTRGGGPCGFFRGG